MGMHDTRRCGCGQTFKLATLMSRETQCAVCQRKQAVALMEARSGERSTVPGYVGGMDRGATGVHHVQSEFITRPAPLRVPLTKPEVAEVARSVLSSRVVLDAYMDTLKSASGDSGGGWVSINREFGTCSEYEVSKRGDYTLETARLNSGRYWWRVSTWGSVEPSPERIAHHCIAYSKNCSEKAYARYLAEKALAKHLKDA